MCVLCACVRGHASSSILTVGVTCAGGRRTAAVVRVLACRGSFNGRSNARQGVSADEARHRRRRGGRQPPGRCRWGWCRCQGRVALGTPGIGECERRKARACDARGRVPCAGRTVDAAASSSCGRRRGISSCSCCSRRRLEPWNEASALTSTGRRRIGCCCCCCCCCGRQLRGRRLACHDDAGGRRRRGCCCYPAGGCCCCGCCTIGCQG